MLRGSPLVHRSAGSNLAIRERMCWRTTSITGQTMLGAVQFASMQLYFTPLDIICGLAWPGRETFSRVLSLGYALFPEPLKKYWLSRLVPWDHMWKGLVLHLFLQNKDHVPLLVKLEKLHGNQWNQIKPVEFKSMELYQFIAAEDLIL